MCGELKDLSEFYFCPSRTRKTKYTQRCKSCLSDIAKSKVKKKKPCPECGQPINLSSNLCRVCVKKTDAYLEKYRATCKKNRRKNYCIDCGDQIGLRAKRCVRCSRSGENNAQWKGGVTVLKERIRDLFEYRQWRSDVFTRDSFICSECNCGGNKLHAHHIVPLNVLIQKYEITSLKQAVDCEELWNINNGITYCKYCHLDLHKQKGYRYELSKC
jgi:predicted RNA-binding Zn-ribbon protein involved in translation (DUF1610 family)